MDVEELHVHETLCEFPQVEVDDDFEKNVWSTCPAIHMPSPRKAPSQPTNRTPARRIEVGSFPLTLLRHSRCFKIPPGLLTAKPSTIVRGIWELNLQSREQTLSNETPFVTIEGVSECLEMTAKIHQNPSDDVELPPRLSCIRVLRIYAAAQLLECEQVIAAARWRVRRNLKRKHLRAATAAALAWHDTELLRLCYWAVVGILCQLPPAPGLGRLGLGQDGFEYQNRCWPLDAFVPALTAATACCRAVKEPATVGSFVVTRFFQVGSEVSLFRETSQGNQSELLRATLCGTMAVIYSPDAAAAALMPPAASGAARMYSEACCGILEVGTLGRCFTLREGFRLLPGQDSEEHEQLRKRFPHAPSIELGNIAWHMNLLSLAPGSQKRRWRFMLEVPGMPKLRSPAMESSTAGIELMPLDAENSTPWLALGPNSGTMPLGEGRALCWRHPISAVLAFATAIAAIHPWDAGLVGAI